MMNKSAVLSLSKDRPSCFACSQKRQGQGFDKLSQAGLHKNIMPYAVASASNSAASASGCVFIT